MEEVNTPPSGEATRVLFSPPHKPPPRVLVVDDNVEILSLNARALSNSGYEVDAAEDGAVAWQNLQRNHYDLLVTDNQMPNLSGVELLQKMYGARLALPVIMATGALPSEDFARSPWLRPAATLLKPYSFEELLGTVREVLHATAAAGQVTDLPPIWPPQPSADRPRLA